MDDIERLMRTNYNDPFSERWRMDMAKNKGKGKKKVKGMKDKGMKVNDVLEQILASMETMSSKLVKLEEKFDTLRPEPARQGVRGPRGDSGPAKSTGSPGAGGGRSQPVTKKKTFRKKSVTGKAVRKKAVTKKAAARKKVTAKKAVARNVTRKKTVKRPAATRKVAAKKTRAKRR
jgi:hypothetical protein